MKVIVCGGRMLVPLTWVDRVKAKLVELGATEVVSGKCRGGDRAGEIAAKELGLPVKKFPAKWSRYGYAAGPVRNFEMAKYADACIVLPGHDGTWDMKRKAIQFGLTVVELPWH